MNGVEIGMRMDANAMRLCRCTALYSQEGREVSIAWFGDVLRRQACRVEHTHPQV